MNEATTIQLNNFAIESTTVDVVLPYAPHEFGGKPSTHQVMFATNVSQVVPNAMLMPLATLCGLYQQNGHEFCLEYDAHGLVAEDHDGPLAPYFSYTCEMLTDKNGVDYVALRVENLNLADAGDNPIYVGLADLAKAVEAVFAVEA